MASDGELVQAAHLLVAAAVQLLREGGLGECQAYHALAVAVLNSHQASHGDSVEVVVVAHSDEVEAAIDQLLDTAERQARSRWN
jgi:hypothetical protein